jgi:hypothetical protein
MGSDFLFAVPTVLSGVARTLDLGGTFDSYNASTTELEADRKAIAVDWKAVGSDLTKAMREFDETHPDPKQLSLSLVEG